VKLISLLKETQKVPASIVDSNLEIVIGSATDLNVLKELLSHNPAIIVSGIGAAPVFHASLFKPMTIDQPTVCGDFTTIFITAIHELGQEGKLAVKPFLVTVSTTGLTEHRDVPWLFYGLYKWLLHVPHEDKRIMENNAIEETLKKDSLLSGFSSVRASLLTDGVKNDALQIGWLKHELDTESKEGPGPAIGYFVSRASVGSFVFEQYIQGDASQWNRRMVTVTN
jgi:hypothetical protein